MTAARTPVRPRPVLLAALLALLLTPSTFAGASDFDWSGLSGCSEIAENGDLVLTTCYGGGPTIVQCEEVAVALISDVPGTFTFNLRFDIESGQQLTEFTAYSSLDGVTLDSYTYGDIWGGAWCAGAPCGGFVPGITLGAAPGALLTFGLDCTETGCVGDNGTRVRVQDLQFTPTPGFHEIVGGLDEAPLLDIDLTSFYNAESLSSLAALGDVDGDGHDDLAFGDTNASAPSNSSGTVLVMSGRTGQIVYEILGVIASSAFGAGLDGLGDVDGDGVPDLAVGQGNFPGSFPYTGRVRLFSGVDGSHIRILGPGQEGSSYGRGLAGPGDVDGDGRGDVLVTAALEDGPLGVRQGAVRLYSGATGAELYTFFGDAVDDRLGNAVAGVGDVDGDGVPDLAATSIYSSLGAPAGGLCRVWSGADGSVLYDITGTTSDRLGDDVAGAGDVDNDGYCDLIVSSDLIDHEGVLNAGAVWVVSGFDGSLLFDYGGTEEMESFGPWVSGAGDLDQDGFDDVLVADTQPLLPGRVVALAGPTGEVLFERADSRYDDYGPFLVGGFDADADGTPDLALRADELLGTRRLLVLSGDPDDHGAPRLSGSGDLVAGAPTEFVVQDGPPSALAFFVFGLSVERAPFKGGLLMPTPDLVFGGLLLDGDGDLTLPFAWPAGVTSPLAGVVQFWMPTPAAPKGFVATNGMVVAPF